MRRLGARAVRIYTIHPPAFYDELARHNTEHPEAPLYLVQGVYFPDEEAWLAAADRWAPGVHDGFRAELTDAYLAVTGRLRRDTTPGRASGTWTTDVGAWVAGWVIGVELDPTAVVTSDRRNAERPARHGAWSRSTTGATPTERWPAEMLDHLAAAEAADGRSSPLAFIGWPTTDPLHHPREPVEEEYLVAVDANHVLPTAAWPGGSFASYHAYPYYPDFLRHEEALGADPYAGYLAALRDHHAAAGLPVMITELGVPSAFGSAHRGPLGRDQGGHTERQAMQIKADLVTVAREQGMAGAMPFAFIDEWFTFTWNTIEISVPGHRRPMWRDELTNEEHFGLVSADAGLADTLWLGAERSRWDTATQTVHEAREGLRRVGVTHDEAFLHLQLRVDDPPVEVAFDVVPGVGAGPLPSGSDVLPGADAAVVVDAGGARLLRWAGADPTTVLHGASADYLEVAPSDLRSGSGAWVRPRLLVNRPVTDPVTGERRLAELHDVSALREGTAYGDHWDRAPGVLQLRIPWSLLGFADPSSRRALVLAPTAPSTPPRSSASASP